MISEAKSRQVFEAVHGGLRVVCAWCETEMRPGPKHPVSHGICPKCSERMFAEDQMRRALRLSLRSK
jgi:hypothetical protein